LPPIRPKLKTRKGKTVEPITSRGGDRQADNTGKVICNTEGGYLVVGAGGDCQITCPTGKLEWRLRYAPDDIVASTAASAIESFDYLVRLTTKEEAWRLIKIMRKAIKEAKKGGAKNA
jgi:hypothetical protein